MVMAILELLHFNDVHARYDGLARLATRVREIRATAQHPVLVLDGGDIEDGGVRLSALTMGVAGWRLLRAAGVDAAVVGNGGLLRYGPAILPRYAEAFGSPPLVCDLAAGGAMPAGAAATRLVSVGEVAVGLIGITDWFPSYADYGLTELPRTTEIVRHAADLRSRGADVVVLLSHAGIEHDRPLATKLAGRIDLIVGGHSHTLLPAGESRDNAVPIVHAGEYAEHLGRVRLEVTADRVRLLDATTEPVRQSTPRDRAVLAELAECERDLAAWSAEPVGALAEPAKLANGADSGVVRLLAEAARQAWSVDVGVLYPVHCAAGIGAGPVARGDVWAATSSPSSPAVATLTGAQLREMLRRGALPERAALRPRPFRGRPLGFLHAVGVARDGNAIFVSGEPLDDTRGYRVAASDAELSPSGGLVDTFLPDLTLDTSRIMPQLLESHLADASPAAISTYRSV